MRTYSDIEQMAAQDYSIGLTAHYKPLANLINERGHKSVIEIGTAYAGNAFHILDNTEITSLICIDPYEYYPAMPGFVCQQEYDTLYVFAGDRLRNHPKYYEVNIMIHRANSRASLSFMPAADLIFLDADHEYESVLWECENYSRLINPGGVLSGHDYNIFEGVNKAVDEFAGKIGKEVKFLEGNIWYMEF